MVIRRAAVDPLEAGGLLLDRRQVAVMVRPPVRLPAAMVRPVRLRLVALLAAVGALHRARLLVVPAALLAMVLPAARLRAHPVVLRPAALPAVVGALRPARLLVALVCLAVPALAYHLATFRLVLRLPALPVTARPGVLLPAVATVLPAAPLAVTVLPVAHPVAATAALPVTARPARSRRPAVVTAVLPARLRLRGGVVLRPVASCRRRLVAAPVSGRRPKRWASVGTP